MWKAVYLRMTVRFLMSFVCFVTLYRTVLGLAIPQGSHTLISRAGHNIFCNKSEGA